MQRIHDRKNIAAKKYVISKTEVQRITAGAKKESPVKNNIHLSSQYKESVNGKNKNVNSLNNYESDNESKSGESLQNFSTLDEIAKAAGYVDNKIGEKNDFKRKFNM